MSLFASKESSREFVDISPSLCSIRQLISGLSIADRRFVTSQITTMINNFYVHLPLKTASMGVSPAQQYLLLLDDVPLIRTDNEFFSRLIGITKGLRDRHTCVKLPQPWSSMIAYLPFISESCWENGRRLLIVSKILSTFEDPYFVAGVEITHWNGVPISAFIESLSWNSDGANPYARIALALRSLTLRPLAYMLPPSEDWVTLTYVAHGEFRSITFPWRVYLPNTGSGAQKASVEPTGTAIAVQGVDKATLLVNSGWADLFSATQQRSAVEDGVTSTLQDNLTFRIAETSSGTFGYIRIFSFQADDTERFVADFANMLASMPQSGLILDVRANPGGTIPSGEALLPLLTTKPVQPEKLSFRGTGSVRQVCSSSSYFTDWVRSLDLVLETGDVFSQGFPISDLTKTSKFAGLFRGPVVLIIDALCYSTTDFFAAGFQDNDVGKIIGVDPVTGAGGANVWTLSQLAGYARAGGSYDLSELPLGIDMSISVRRSTRVGRNDGLPLEGLGVRADLLYRPTRRDVLGQNEDLIEYAASVLRGMK